MKKAKSTACKLSLLLLALLPSVASAQRYTASLPDTLKAGFYKILLTPDIVARSMPGLPDIRLINRAGKQTPYILNTAAESTMGNSFQDFPIVSCRKAADHQTHLILQSVVTAPLQQLVLKLRNTEAQRRITVSGSNNFKDWFVISEGISLNNNAHQEGGLTVASLGLPQTDYRYYDVTILGKDILPPSIVQAGIYESFATPGSASAVPPPQLFQRDSSNGSSYIRLHFNAAYTVNFLRFSCSGQKYYHRNIGISRQGADYAPDALFSLSSDRPTVLPVSSQSQDIFLQIVNGDSPPLHIDSVSALQSDIYLLAYFDNNQGYQLTFGDSTLRAPSYDFTYFKDSALLHTTLIQPGPVAQQAIQRTVLPVKKHADNQLLLWLTIAFVSTGVLVLSLRMAREVKKRG